MEPADYMKITMSVAEAKELLQPFTPERCVADSIATAIRGKKLTPIQAQAALVLAWNDLLYRTQFGISDWDRGEHPCQED